MTPFRWRRNLRRRDLEQGRVLRRRLLFAGAGLFGLYLLIPLLLGDMGIVHWLKLRQLRRQLLGGIESLSAQNRELGREIERLRSDPEMIERIAREQLGLVRPGELVYKFQPAPPARAE